MRTLELSGLVPKRFRRTTIRVPGVRVADDLVERNFVPAAANQLWCADIKYVRSWQGFLYLAAVMDCYSRRIVGWSMRSDLGAELVVDALEMAIARRAAEARSRTSLRPGLAGRIQLVVATPRDGGGARWVFGSVSGRFVRCGARCGRRAGRRWRGGRIGSGSGGRSPAASSSEEAAAAAGVSQAVGSRWFRDGGGMPPISLAPLSGRYLSFAEREEIAILHAQRVGVREIARRLNRSASTISRELRRNASTRSYRSEYRATTAQWHAERRASRPKVSKLAANDALREYVQERLAGTIARPDGEPVPGPEVRFIGRRHGRRQDRRWAKAWSPEQIANRLRIDFPDDDSMRISHEAIYQALYVQGRGALRRELVACLRTGRALRVPRARTQARGKKFVTRRGDDQRAAGRGRRPRRARPLGGRSDPRAQQLGDRDAGRAHHPLHDAAAPAAHAGPRRPAASEERARADRPRRRGRP